MSLARGCLSCVPHKTASGVSPAAPWQSQKTPGRRLPALQAESAQSPNSTELGQILTTGFERIAGQFERIEGQFANVFEQLQQNREELQQNREELQQNREHADARFDQLGSDVSEVRQQGAANGTVLGADNEDRIADSLSPTYGADAVRGATLRSGASIIQRFEQPIVSCGLTVDVAAENLLQGICKVAASRPCGTYCSATVFAKMLLTPCCE